MCVHVPMVALMPAGRKDLRPARDIHVRVQPSVGADRSRVPCRIAEVQRLAERLFGDSEERVEPDVLIDFGPVDPIAEQLDLAVVALLRGGLRQALRPGKRDAEHATIGEVDVDVLTGTRIGVGSVAVMSPLFRVPRALR